jgi:NAD(P)-dependent dehydrogenase (short-subunit alcohol dehydrogenase family)
MSPNGQSAIVTGGASGLGAEAARSPIPFPHRLGQPDEFARLVLHIVSKLALNGEVFRLDGALCLAPK